MSTWFRIRIEEREGPHLGLQLEVQDAVNGDYFPDTPDWALRLLSEATWTYIRGSERAAREASPLGAALSPDTNIAMLSPGELWSLGGATSQL